MYKTHWTIRVAIVAVIGMMGPMFVYGLRYDEINEIVDRFRARQQVKAQKEAKQVLRHENTISSCPWKREDWTLAMCQEWYKTQDLGSPSITFKGEKITSCGATPSSDELATFDTCINPQDHTEIKLLNTSGRPVTIIMVKAAQEPLCRAVILARSAKPQAFELRFSTSYRDFAGQVKVFCNAFLKTGKIPSSDTATPGFSIHGRGIKVDVFLFNSKGEQLTFFRGDVTGQNKSENVKKLVEIMAAGEFTLDIPQDSQCFTYQSQQYEREEAKKARQDLAEEVSDIVLQRRN